MINEIRTAKFYERQSIIHTGPSRFFGPNWPLRLVDSADGNAELAGCL